MKKLLVSWLLILVCCIFISCGDTVANNDSSNIKGLDGKKTESSSSSPQKETNKKSESSSAISQKEPEYMGNMTVEYDEVNAQHKVFWSFRYEESGDYVPADATIHIRIENDNGEMIFSKDYDVDKNYYSMWTKDTWDSDRLLGCIYITDQALEKGTIDTGTLIISADTYSGSFNETKKLIYNLPLKDMEISIPDLPYEVKELYYDGSIHQKGEVLDFKIAVESIVNKTTFLSYDIKYKVTYNAEGENKTQYANIGYKIKDSEGVVILSSSIIVGQLAQGETIKTSGYITGNFSLGETYTLEFVDI